MNTEGVLDARESKGPTPIHSPVHTFISLLNPDKSVTHALHPTLKGSGDKLFYAQLIQSSGFNTGPAIKDGSKALIKIKSGDKNVVLGEGDGVFVRGGKTGDEFVIENVGDKRGEIILFEMDA